MGKPQRRGDHWVWVDGPVAPGASATTLGSLILVRASAVDNDQLMRHELVHVRQWRSLGLIGFLRRYLGAYFHWRFRGYPHWGAYRRIPLEIEADWEARTLVRSPKEADDR